MGYFIFQKNFDNIEGSLFKIAESDSDLNSLNLPEETYKLIQVSNDDFISVKLNTKFPLKYNEEQITYKNYNYSFANSDELKKTIDSIKKVINCFLENNKDHIFYNKWNNYLSQLNNINLNTVTYPLNKSLEQYFNDLQQPYLNILQIP